MTKSSSTASADGYTMEGYPGTKKPSWISPKEVRVRGWTCGRTCVRLRVPAGLNASPNRPRPLTLPHPHPHPPTCTLPQPVQKRGLLAEAREKAERQSLAQ